MVRQKGLPVGNPFRKNRFIFDETGFDATPRIRFTFSEKVSRSSDFERSSGINPS
jgi:hypothetical protein